MIDVAKFEPDLELELPLGDQEIPAGFLTPVDDGVSASIDLNRELIRHPETTFCGRVRGESMAGDEIHDGDILIIDRSEDWALGDAVVACVNGEFTLKRIERRGVNFLLAPANSDFPAIPLEEGDEVRIWGVVKYVIHKR